MDTMSAKNFLQNTEVKFKVKMIATIIPAAIFLITILIEGITGTGIQIMQNIYLIFGLILLVATGAVVKLLKIALSEGHLTQEALLVISGELGAKGYSKELIELIEPVYDFNKNDI